MDHHYQWVQSSDRQLFQGQEVAKEIHIHNRSPLFGIGLGYRFGNQDCGIGDHDIHPAEFGYSGIEQRLHVGLIGHVHFRIRAFDVRRDDVGAHPRQVLANGLTESLATAGHNCNLVFQWGIHAGKRNCSLKWTEASSSLPVAVCPIGKGWGGEEGRRKQSGREAKQPLRIGGGNARQFFDRHPFELGKGFGNVRNEGRLIALAALRNRRQIGGVGFE